MWKWKNHANSTSWLWSKTVGRCEVSSSLGWWGSSILQSSNRPQLGKEMEAVVPKLMMLGSLFPGYGDSRGPVGYIQWGDPWERGEMIVERWSFDSVTNLLIWYVVFFADFGNVLGEKTPPEFRPYCQLDTAANSLYHRCGMNRSRILLFLSSSTGLCIQRGRVGWKRFVDLLFWHFEKQDKFSLVSDDSGVTAYLKGKDKLHYRPSAFTFQWFCESKLN